MTPTTERLMNMDHAELVGVAEGLAVALRESRETLSQCLAVWSRRRSQNFQREVENDATFAVGVTMETIDAAIATVERVDPDDVKNRADEWDRSYLSVEGR